MKSPRDDSMFRLDPDDARDNAAAHERRAGDASSPSLARWYRASVPAPADRARHLQRIGDAVARATERRSTRGIDEHEMRDDAQRVMSVHHMGDRREDVGNRPVRSRELEAPYVERAPPSRTESAPERPARRQGAVGAVGGVRSPWLRAAALVAFATGGISLLAHGRSDALLTPRDSATRDIGFALRLADDGVRQVSIAGDFNGWNASAIPMVRDPADGTWRVRIPLAPGRHTYSYVIDGTRWVIDPLAPRTVEGALGPANVIAVAGDT